MTYESTPGLYFFICIYTYIYFFYFYHSHVSVKFIKGDLIKAEVERSLKFGETSHACKFLLIDT